MKPFHGFRSPNYTQVPDELFDELLPDLSGAELKVLLYIIRRTFGFKRDSDNISLRQMLEGITTNDGRQLDRGVGLSKPTLLKALRELTERNIIIPNRRTSPEKGDQATNYRLHIASETARDSTSRQKSNGSDADEAEAPPVVKKLAQGVVKKLYQGVVKEVNQPVVKEFAHTKDSRQETVNVNVTPAPEEDLKRDSLVLQMLDTCGDPHSTGFYRRVAQELPSELIFRALSETRGLAATGGIRKSPGAAFTDAVTRIAREHGYDLVVHGSP